MDFEDLEKYLAPVLEKLGTMEEDTLKNYTDLASEITQNAIFMWGVKRNLRRSVDAIVKLRNGETLDKKDIKAFTEVISWAPYLATYGVKRAQASYDRFYSALDALKATKRGPNDPDDGAKVYPMPAAQDTQSQPKRQTVNERYSDILKEGGF